MIKLSVNETKWSSLLARTRALNLYIWIWIFDFGAEKLPELSRNGPQVDKEPLCGCATCKSLFIYFIYLLLLLLFTFSICCHPEIFLPWQRDIMTCSLSYYPGYQRFFLACDQELRRPQADTSSAFRRRHDRHPKPRMKSLWHPGYSIIGFGFRMICIFRSCNS